VAWLAWEFLRAALLRDVSAEAALLRGRQLALGDRIESKGHLIQS
jgi:hypothetical protein